ncbi:flagellar hook-associated protein FlgK [Methylocapsa aurea]|uniref:flagellar hook-associated protein FlgK n=1 Tax=Methylocapsa aurea TaxID=663610 RepID=UPI00055C1B98|nr:flagellar hook-associated protein FlgK [Methylocapsa aurea]
MSLSSAASVARSGLNAVAAETSALSRNISGTGDTAIYSRKIANVVSTLHGSQVASVTRASSRAVFENVLSATSAFATQDAISAGLDALNRTIGDVASSDADATSSASSPAALLSQFTNALQLYQASPGNSTLAGGAVSAAKALAGGLNSAAATISYVREQADSDMAASIQTINSLLVQFKTANTAIVYGTAIGADTTDAQDQRDNILTQLAQEVGIATTVGANSDMSIYTDSGVTLFQGGIARAVTFAATNVYTAAAVGNAVYVDGVAVTGGAAPMPIATGALAGFAALRDDLSVTYQAQLDALAEALINVFTESDQVGSGPSLPGLFTTAGATSLPANINGLAAQVMVNASVDPNQGGDANLLRDGGISDPGNLDYLFNASGDASYGERLSQLLDNLSATRTFGTAGGIATNVSLSDYASGSASWLEAARARVSSQGAYQDALLSTATTALSNATGVNLDDEMSKMLDLEQSYSASAKLIATIDGMFQALLTAI